MASDKEVAAMLPSYGQHARRMIGQIRAHLMRQESKTRIAPTYTPELLMSRIVEVEKLYKTFIRLTTMKGYGPFYPAGDPFYMLLEKYRTDASQVNTSIQATHYELERHLDILMNNMHRQLCIDIRGKWGWILYSDQPWYKSVPPHRFPLPEAAMQQEEPPARPLREDELPEIECQVWQGMGGGAMSQPPPQGGSRKTSATRLQTSAEGSGSPKPQRRPSRSGSVTSQGSLAGSRSSSPSSQRRRPSPSPPMLGPYRTPVFPAGSGARPKDNFVLGPELPANYPPQYDDDQDAQ